MPQNNCETSDAQEVPKLSREVENAGRVISNVGTRRALLGLELGLVGASVLGIMANQVLEENTKGKDQVTAISNSVDDTEGPDDTMDEAGNIMHDGEIEEFLIDEEIEVDENEMLAAFSSDFVAPVLEWQSFDPLQAEFSTPATAPDEPVLLQNHVDADRQDVMA